MAKSQKYIWSSKMNEKGQIVIPKEAREIFNLKAGDGILLFGDTERGIAIAKQDEYIKFAEKIFSLSNGGDYDKNK